MSNNQTMNYFDQRASSWDMNQEIGERNDVVAHELAQVIPLSTITSALEIGAGTGQLGFQLARQLGRLLLVDGSAKMGDQQREGIARLGLTNVDTRQLELGSQDFPEENFDLIYSVMAFHHIQDIPQTLSTIAGHQKTGDWLAIIDLIGEDGSFHAHAPELPVHKGFDPMWMGALLGNAGYEIKHNRIIHEIKRPRMDKTVAIYPLFMIVAVRK